MTTISRVSRGLVVLAATGALVFAGGTSASADTLPPTYYPSGPQTNVDPADLEGWTLCYSGTYADNDIELFGAGGILDELCTGDYLLLAGAPVDSPTLALLAAAPRADVLTDTTQDETTTHNANGSEWYFNGDLSWGFALGGDPVQKTSCDVNYDDNPDLRLCWHTNSATLQDGYRAGDNDLNGNSGWARFVYQADGTVAAAPALAATGADVTGPALLAGGLLALGAASLAFMAATRRRALR